MTKGVVRLAKQNGRVLDYIIMQTQVQNILFVLIKTYEALDCLTLTLNENEKSIMLKEECYLK